MSAAHASPGDSFNRSLQTLAESLPQPARSALDQMPDPNRRLLAARSYVKAGHELADKWSWSEAQADAFEASPEYKEMQSAIGELTREFEKQNPGYSLFINTQVRSLELQLQRWNSNPGVKRTADALADYVSTQVGEHKVKTPEELRALLMQWHPSSPAPLAAPGLSAHGQMRALDFQVVRGSTVIAGPSMSSVASVWQRGGWAERLHRAVTSINAKFEGPLLSPNEPWHYRYVP